MWYDTSQGTHYNYGTAEATANAWEIYNYFRGLSAPWAVESIAALCGNAQLESIMNPFIRSESESGAFGLWQWITNKRTMINWANSQGLRPTSGPAQVRYVEAERSGAVQDTQYLPRGEFSGVSFNDFAYNQDNLSVRDLTRCWWNNYERSAAWQEDRARWAAGYYQLFTGGPPPTPGTVPTWLLYKWKERKRIVKCTIRL